QGPQIRLTPAEIAGVYPAEGSNDSPDDFLAHIALARRTLPWERVGPAANTSWLALLLLKDSEMSGADGARLLSTNVGSLKLEDPDGYNRLRVASGIADDTAVDVLSIQHAVLRPLLPKNAHEVALLAHVKQTTVNGSSSDVSVVIGNRL